MGNALKPFRKSALHKKLHKKLHCIAGGFLFG